MKIDIMNKFSGIGKIALEKMRQSKPEYKLILGGIGLLGGTILACTKTKEAVDAIETTKNELRGIKKRVEEEHLEGTPESIRAYTGAYARFARKMTKIYGVAALAWVGGMATIVDSHIDLRKENTKLLIDSVAFKKIVDEYRERVAKEIGEDREKQLYFDSNEEEFEVLEENPETGTKKVVRKKGNIIKNRNAGSKFARNFSPQTSYEYDVRSYADYFLAEKVKMLNQRLRITPFITMNEVYDELGMKAGYGRCADGLDWGWVWNPNDPDGPNEIIIERLDGWEEIYNERENRTFWAPCTRIDFNCQPLKGRI